MPFTVADAERAELAVTFASLILADDKAEITSENIQKLLDAASIEGVEPYWPKLFAGLLKGRDVSVLLAGSGSVGSGPAAGGAPAAGGDAPAAKVEEEEEEEEEVAGGGAGFSLFGEGGDEGGY